MHITAILLKHRKAKNSEHKQKILDMIQELFHRYNGVPGYRQMRIYLEREGIFLSYPTVHKYMNKELGLTAIVRRKRKNFHCSGEHKVFKNLLNRDFTTPRANMKWATDFTFLYLKDGRVRYNCTIIDLYDRSVVSSLTGSRMTGELAKETLSRALKGCRVVKNLILHSDQGSPYTSRVFCEYCERAWIIQSMSRAGCPYDNAPMERYFNTLKTEHINLHEYEDEDSLYQAVEEFAYVHYNHVRPHTYNNQRTPFEARVKISRICYKNT